VTFLRRRLIPLLAVLLAAGSLAACGGGTTTHRAVKTQCSYAQDPGGAAKKASLPPGNPPKDLPDDVTIATNRGDIKISLAKDQAPCTVNSFVALAEQGYFDNTHCHRLTTSGIFVLQCGDPKATGQVDDPKAGAGGPGYYVKDELVKGDPRLQPCLNQTEPATGKQICTYTTGTVAMANAGPDTGGSQFFLGYKDSQLPNAYTAFGRMSAAGVKVVQAVAAGGAYPEDARQNTPPRLETVITSVK
jgi:peptidyl-prolyl cis-trans isomerase B (cyclophilin B)